MATYIFSFFEADGVSTTNAVLTYTINGDAPVTLVSGTTASVPIPASANVIISCNPDDVAYSIWTRNFYLPENPISGQENISVIFDDSITVVNENNEFSIINIPCTSNVQVVDNVSQTGVYNIVWDFGDGTSASGTSVIHTYKTPGRYTITKTVTFCQEP